MRLSWWLNVVELLALGLLLYSLLFFNQSLRLPVLLLVFGVLVGTGSTWVLHTNYISHWLPADFKRLFIRVVLIGSVLLLIIAAYLVVVSVV